jgi:hypothetical protein
MYVDKLDRKITETFYETKVGEWRPNRTRSSSSSPPTNKNGRRRRSGGLDVDLLVPGSLDRRPGGANRSGSRRPTS